MTCFSIIFQVCNYTITCIPDTFFFLFLFLIKKPLILNLRWKKYFFSLEQTNSILMIKSLPDSVKSRQSTLGLNDSQVITSGIALKVHLAKFELIIYVSWDIYHISSLPLNQNNLHNYLKTIFPLKIHARRLRLITRWKIVRKTMHFYEKLENKYVERCGEINASSWLLPWKFFHWVVMNLFFSQNIKDVGRHIFAKMNMRWRTFHHIPKFIFLLIIQISYFSYHFADCYQLEPNNFIWNK